MSIGRFVPRNEEIFGDDRELNIDYIVDNEIKYGPTLIDTMTFSFKHFRDSEILSFLQPFGFDFQALKDGDSFIPQAGYERVYICQRTHSTLKCGWLRLDHSEISVLSITGSGCSLLSSQDKMLDFCFAVRNFVKAFGLLGDFYSGDRQFKCTRIDLCKDNFTEYFYNVVSGDYGELSKKFYSQGLAMTPNITFKNGKLKNGWTLYFGMRNNCTFVRLYDKKTEQRVKDERLSHWARLEIEIKNKNDCLRAHNTFTDIINGKSLDDIFVSYCQKSFFFTCKVWDEDRNMHKDDLPMDKEFKRFIEYRWDNSSQKQCFANSLFFLQKTKNDECCRKLASALVPRVYSNKSVREIAYNLHEFLYPDGRDYRIDNTHKCIYVYYTSPTGNIMDDIPCLAVDVPSIFWDDVAYYAGTPDCSYNDLIEFIDRCNLEWHQMNFTFSDGGLIQTL